MSRKISSFLAGIIIFIIFSQILSWFFILVYAETETAFTPDNKFEIPQNNSSISFSTNGTYEMASLKKGTWIFGNLHFINSQGQEKIDLKVSATNCDVTVDYYMIYDRIFDGENVKRARLRYTIFGYGTQIFNLGLDPKAGQLDAILDGEWVGKNRGWTHSSDGTFTVTGATENVSLLYYGYPGSDEDNKNVFNNHSVVIASTFSFGIVIFLAVVIARRKVKK